jgi:hut operon positive regulator
LEYYRDNRRSTDFPENEIKEEIKEKNGKREKSQRKSRQILERGTNVEERSVKERSAEKFTRRGAEEREQDLPIFCDTAEEVKEGLHLLLDFDLGANDVARAALLVALTKDVETEAAFKRNIELRGWRVVATEVGGLLNELPAKLVRAIVGASLNAGVIEKSSREMHSLVHAASEAGDSFVHRGILEVSMGAKIAIVRNDLWLAVAVFGDCAVHATAHHDRCGLGVMHI